MRVTMSETRVINEIVKALEEAIDVQSAAPQIVQSTIEVRLDETKGVALYFDEGDTEWSFEVLDYTADDIPEGDIDEDEVPAPAPTLEAQTIALPITR